MKVVQTRTFPLSAERLLALLTSQEFYISRYNILEVSDYRFKQCEQTDAGFVIEISREIEIKTDRIPAFARRFVGDKAELSTKFVWQTEGEGPYEGRYSVEMAAAPVAISGVAVISALKADTCQQEITLDIKSSLPLVGKKLAALLAERVEKVLEEDYQATLRYLDNML